MRYRYRPRPARPEPVITVQVVVTGVNYTVQQAVDGGTNVTVGSDSAAETVTVSGAQGSTIGVQTSGGTNASMVGSQAVHDAAVANAAQQPLNESWWARLRKRGAVVAIAAVITAIAGVAAVIVTILIAAGWKP